MNNAEYQEGKSVFARFIEEYAGLDAVILFYEWR